MKSSKPSKNEAAIVSRKSTGSCGELCGMSGKHIVHQAMHRSQDSGHASKGTLTGLAK